MWSTGKMVPLAIECGWNCKKTTTTTIDIHETSALTNPTKVICMSTPLFYGFAIFSILRSFRCIFSFSRKKNNNANPNVTKRNCYITNVQRVHWRIVQPRPSTPSIPAAVWSNVNENVCACVFVCEF